MRIRAKNGNGWGPFTNKEKAEVSTMPGKLGKPLVETTYKLPGDNRDRVIISWMACEFDCTGSLPITQYELYVNFGGKYELVYKGLKTTFIYSLPPSKPHIDFKVRAVNASSPGTFSDLTVVRGNTKQT